MEGVCITPKKEERRVKLSYIKKFSIREVVVLRLRVRSEGRNKKKGKDT